MGHHSLVDELESHALAVLQADRLGLRVLLVIDGPEIALHVAGQADLDLPRRLAHFIEWRSEEHTSELQSLMRISYAVFCLKKKKKEIRPKHTKSAHIKQIQITTDNKHIQQYS